MSKYIMDSNGNLTREIGVEKMYDKLALIFGLSNNHTRNLPYIQIIERLVIIVEEYEKLIKEQKEIIETNNIMYDSLNAYLTILQKVNGR